MPWLLEEEGVPLPTVERVLLSRVPLSRVPLGVPVVRVPPLTA